MRSQFLILSVVLSSVLLSACGGTATVTNNAPAANTNSNNPLETTKKTPDQIVNDAPTLTPVFKAYCNAWAKNDVAALRKLYSQNTLKEFDAGMKAEKIKSLLKFLEMDRISGTPCVARNEQITGDTAVAELTADIYPKGFKMVLVKENGEWKLTTRGPDIDSVKQSAANSNTAK